MPKYGKGVSGNPKGRPPIERAWAELIRRAGKGEIELADGTKVLAQQLVANIVMQALLTGRLTFPRLKGERSRHPRILPFDARDYTTFLMKTIGHLEPGPRQEYDLTSDGEQIEFANNVHVYIPDNGRGGVGVPPAASTGDVPPEPG